MPGGDFHPIWFVIVAAWVLVCGVGVVAFKNIVYSAVSMVFCFLGVAGVFVLLNAGLLAIIQILLYVGAISVVILFAIMLTEAQKGDYRLFFNRQTALSVVLTVCAVGLLGAVLVTAELPPNGDVSRNIGLNKLSDVLFNQYAFPFELVSLVLLGAMVGAIVLARKEEGE